MDTVKYLTNYFSDFNFANNPPEPESFSLSTSLPSSLQDKQITKKFPVTNSETTKYSDMRWVSSIYYGLCRALDTYIVE